jgi:predicted NBD/HSP70 family sugar kinase
MVVAVRAPHVRRANLTIVLDHLRRHGPSSRSQLVAATGLTRSAIAGLVGELESLRLVIEAAPESDGSPGRPSPVVRIDDRHVGALAIEIFVDEIGVAIVALDGSIVTSIRLARPRERVAVAETVSDVVGLVRRLQAQRRSRSTGRAERRIIGIGISVPGLIRQSDNVVVAAPNLGWTDVAVASLLDEALDVGLPSSVGNDADLGALAESRFGAGVGSDHMLFVTGEVGVGGGFVVGGSPVTGHSGYAGEIGHFPVNPAGSRCTCGAIGCWETEVGERAVLQRAGLDEDGGGRAVDELLARAESAHEPTLAALSVEATWLATGITGLINVFDPDTVVLGGLFSRILPIIGEQLQAELASLRYMGVPRDVLVVGAVLGSQAVTVGAAELAFGPLLADPARVMAGPVGRDVSRSATGGA